MKCIRYILVFGLLWKSNLLLGQFSLVLYGGLGYDISKVSSSEFSLHEPFTHVYNGRTAKFTVLEPRSIGAQFSWMFSSQLDMSLGVTYRYTQRNIIGSIYTENPSAGTFPKLDINMRNTALGITIRKGIRINDNSSLFFQAGVFREQMPTGRYQPSREPDRNTGLEDIPVGYRQVVRYEQGDDYFSLVEILPQRAAIGYQFGQGYLFKFAPRLSWGLSATFAYQRGASSTFLIWEWDEQAQSKLGRYDSNQISYKSLFFDTFIAYAF